MNADNFDDAHQTLLEIAELTTPFGTSTQRVAAYFGEAIICSHMICFLFIYLQWKISSIVLIFICKMSTLFETCYTFFPKESSRNNYCIVLASLGHKCLLIY